MVPRLADALTQQVKGRIKYRLKLICIAKALQQDVLEIDKLLGSSVKELTAKLPDLNSLQNP